MTEYYSGKSKSGLTEKDFEIGQWVTLVEELPMDNGSRVGDTYEITDIDWHFPNKICVRIINKEEDVDIQGFFHIDYFDSKIAQREKKIDKLLDNE
jgi:hypothetical protein